MLLILVLPEYEEFCSDFDILNISGDIDSTKRLDPILEMLWLHENLLTIV